MMLVNGFQLKLKSGEHISIDEVNVGDVLMEEYAEDVQIVSKTRTKENCYLITTESGLTFELGETANLHLFRRMDVQLSNMSEDYPYELSVPISEYVNWRNNKKRQYRLKVYKSSDPEYFKSFNNEKFTVVEDGVKNGWEVSVTGDGIVVDGNHIVQCLK